MCATVEGRCLEYLVCITWGWSPKFETGLNFMIGIDQKIYEWPGCSFPKMINSWGGVTLAKVQLGNSYTF